VGERNSKTQGNVKREKKTNVERGGTKDAGERGVRGKRTAKLDGRSAGYSAEGGELYSQPRFNWVLSTSIEKREGVGEMPATGSCTVRTRRGYELPTLKTTTTKGCHSN